jgi:hypothetical protein
MTEFTALREDLISLQHRTLTTLACRAGENVVDAGLLSLLAGIRAALTAIDEENGQGN